MDLIDNVSLIADADRHMARHPTPAAEILRFVLTRSWPIHGFDCTRFRFCRLPGPTRYIVGGTTFHEEAVPGPVAALYKMEPTLVWWMMPLKRRQNRPTGQGDGVCHFHDFRQVLVAACPLDRTAPHRELTYQVWACRAEVCPTNVTDSPKSEHFDIPPPRISSASLVPNLHFGISCCFPRSAKAYAPSFAFRA